MQADLAAICGVTRKTVAEQLAELKRMKLIERGYAGVRLLDEEGLQTFAARLAANAA